MAIAVALLCGLLPGLRNNLLAQSIVSASNSDSYVNSITADPGNDVTVNCDMLEYYWVNEQTHQQYQGRLKAVAYGRTYTTPNPGNYPTEAHVWVDDGMNTITIDLPDSAAHPDVVLAEIVNGNVVDYKVLVTYDSSPVSYVSPGVLANPRINQPHLVMYDLIGVGTGSLSYAMTTPPGGSTVDPLPLSSNLYCGGYPHIDMFSDAGNPNPFSGLPSMHEFGLVYEDGGVVTEQDGDVPTLYLSFPNSVRDGEMPDVAALTETNSGNQYLEITYVQTPVSSGVYQLWEGEYDVATTISSHSLLEDSVQVFSPHIEAMSQYDGSASRPPAKWQVAASVKFVRSPWIGGGPLPLLQPLPCRFPNPYNYFQCAGYNNFTPVASATFGSTCSTAMQSYHMDVSYDIPSFRSLDFKSPCVAAGTGLSVSTANIGNHQYTIGFFPWQSGSSNFYERRVDANTHSMIDPDAYAVSSGSINYQWDAARSCAVSNSSNSGRDILSAWYDGADVLYKLSTPNVMAFRISRPWTGSGQVSLYPNPATSTVRLSGNEGGKYSITDITGRSLQGGIVAQNGAIDVALLPAGFYMLRTGTSTFRFTKE